MQPVAREHVIRRRPPARSRSRGAGTRGHCRHRGCRIRRRGSRAPSPSTRCATPAAPCPTATPSSARPAWPPSTARSRRGCACARRRRPGRPRSRAARRRVRCESDAVLRQRVDLEIHALALDHVGVTGLDELRDQRLHPIDPLGRAGRLGRRLDVEAVELLRELGLVLRGELGLGRLIALRPVDDVVVDVGDVADVRDCQPAPHEVAADRVEHDLLATVAEMGRVVRRWAAHVHRHLSGDARNEVDLGTPRRCRRYGAPLEATERLTRPRPNRSSARQQRDRPDRDPFGATDRAHALGAFRADRHVDAVPHRFLERRKHLDEVGSHGLDVRRQARLSRPR